MKQIELTENHKSKLLEMCKILFPEYKHIQIRNYYSMSDYVFQIDKPDGSENNGFDAIEFLTEKGYQYEIEDYDGKGYSIHWFEFCITHLSHAIIFNPKNPLKVCNHNHVGLLESVMHLFYNEEQAIHPVDYLYEEFKKLNNEK